MPEPSFSPVRQQHLQQLAEILNYYILYTTVTFHTETVQAEEMAEKVFFSSPIYQAFVIADAENITGYCAVSPWKKQEAYRHTAEINIYLDENFTGKGIGSRAVKFMEDFAVQNDIHNLIAGICCENVKSIRLFQKAGYIQCAHFREVGRKFGKVLDTVYYQKKLA